MKGLFIPGITVEMFRKGSLEGIVELMTKGEIFDIDYQEWIPVTVAAPPKGTICLWCNKQGRVFVSAITYRSKRNSYVGKHGYFSNRLENYGNIVAWLPLPKPYEPESEEQND